jgi:hypothetical protein
MNTAEWLDEYLEKIHNGTPFTHGSRQWIPVAGFRRCGTIFCIYRDEKEYCAHAGEEWPENTPPLFGMFSLQLSWDQLISEISKKYDELRGHKIEGI